MTKIRAVAIALGAVAAFAAGSPALAQKADENAVVEAEDAFGFRSGTEVSGLYDDSDTRGFSPTVAGNNRIEGLYVDLQNTPSQHLSEDSSIRVGSATLGSVLPAPSGLVDYRLRATEHPRSLGARVTADSFGLLGAEVDGAAGTDDRHVSLTAGATLEGAGSDYRGTTPRRASAALIARWQAVDALRLTAFYDLSRVRRRAEPFYYTAGPYAPPEIRRGVFRGQPWSQFHGLVTLVGGIVEARLSERLQLTAGVFHSRFEDYRDTYDLFENVTRGGIGNQTVFFFPQESFASTSGETRLNYTWRADGVRQQWTLGVRGRSVHSSYGGASETIVGPGSIVVPGNAPYPGAPGGQPQTLDSNTQLTAMAGYRLETRLLELDSSVGYARYRKAVATPPDAERDTASDPTLFSVLLGFHPMANTLAYVSASRGLEDSGVAPFNAVNRNEVLRAIVTRQEEIGIRGTIDGLKLAATFFQISKPYAALRPDGVFAIDGEVRHRGLEASATGRVSPRFSVLAGLVLIDGHVFGSLVNAGSLDSRPFNIPAVRAQLAADYAPQWSPNTSLDVVTNFQGPKNAKLDGSYRLPHSTVVDIGLRQRFGSGEQPLVLRAQVHNVFDTYIFVVAPDEAFEYAPGRSFKLSLTKEF